MKIPGQKRGRQGEGGGPKNARERFAFCMPPVDPEQCARWRRAAVFGIAGEYLTEDRKRIPTKVCSISLQAGITDQLGDLAGTLAEVIHVLVAAGVIRDPAAVADFDCRWDRVIEPGVVFVEVSSARDPARRASAEVRMRTALKNRKPEPIAHAA